MQEEVGEISSAAVPSTVSDIAEEKSSVQDLHTATQQIGGSSSSSALPEQAASSSSSSRPAETDQQAHADESHSAENELASMSVDTTVASEAGPEMSRRVSRVATGRLSAGLKKRLCSMKGRDEEAKKQKAESIPPPPPPPEAKLNSSEETCAICCCDAEEGTAVSLACGHGWYCKDCLQRHAEARLDVGDVHVPCPECRAAVPERDLRRAIPGEVVDRFLARSLERAVSMTEDLWACPTPNCPMRVALEADDNVTRFRCTMCKRASCVRCNAQPYHRGLTCEEYAKQKQTRKRAHQVDDGTEAMLKWMAETGTKQCPKCKMGVSKQNLQTQASQKAECHKMLCRNCGTRFCFKCNAELTETFNCGCSIDLHGFVDPETGKRLDHFGADHFKKKKAAAAAGRANKVKKVAGK